MLAKILMTGLGAVVIPCNGQELGESHSMEDVVEEGHVIGHRFGHNSWPSFNEKRNKDNKIGVSQDLVFDPLVKKEIKIKKAPSLGEEKAWT